MELCPGYLVLESFASPEEVQRLRSRADELVDSFSPESVSVFSTKSQVTRQSALTLPISHSHACEAPLAPSIESKASSPPAYVSP